MYCIHCGAEGAATFCATCGQRQITVSKPDLDAMAENVIVAEEVLEASEVVSLTDSSSALPVSESWTDSIQYQTILSHPVSREYLAAAGQRATKQVTGEDLLAVFDAVSPIGISLGKLSHAILPIYDKLGIKTGCESQAIFDAAPGRVMLAVLCTLATKSLAVTEVGQDTDKCSLLTEIPWGFITNRGSLNVLISAHDRYVEVSLTTTISGQWYDFGRSKRLSDQIFEAIHADLTRQQQGRPPRYRRVA